MTLSVMEATLPAGEPEPPDGAVTVMEVDPATLVLVASARTVSPPEVLPAVYVTEACPLSSVTPLVALSAAPLVLVDSENVTVSPGIGLPLASVTMAVRIAVPPAFTVLGEASSCTRAGGPWTKSMVMLVRNPSTSAVTTAVSTMVLAVKSTCARPFVSVVPVTLPLLSALGAAVVLETSRVARTTGDAESVPAVVANVTDTPDMPAPDALVTWIRSGMVLLPSATTAVNPVVVDRDRWMALVLLVGV